MDEADRNVVSVNGKSMSEIKFPERLAARYHNESLKKDASVWMIWSDGRVTLTKGGDLFGQRSLHEMAGDIPGTKHFGWSSEFPVKVEDNLSYAIVQNEEQAHEIREAIIDCVCSWLESRKKLRY